MRCAASKTFSVLLSSADSQLSFLMTTASFSPHTRSPAVLRHFKSNFLMKTCLMLCNWRIIYEAAWVDLKALFRVQVLGLQPLRDDEATID
jgi:hypothetical protein